MTIQGTKLKPYTGEYPNQVVALRYGTGCMYGDDCFYCPFPEECKAPDGGNLARKVSLATVWYKPALPSQ